MRRISATLLSAVLVCSWTLSASAATIYGTAYLGPSGPATLYTINSTTGAATSVGATGFNRVGAIDFDPLNGMLYGIGVDPVSSNFDLITLNIATGVATPVGPLGVGDPAGLPGFADMSFRSDGALYAIDGANTVYTINTSTGAATSIGKIGVSTAGGNALAFSLSDALYKVDSAFAFLVDQTNGTGTIVSAINYPTGSSNANGMDFDPATGALFASVRGSERGIVLATIDVATGSVTKIGQSVTGLDGLAVQPSANGVPDAMSTLWLATPVGMMLFFARQRRRAKLA
jgi:hypothetical protein